VTNETFHVGPASPKLTTAILSPTGSPTAGSVTVQDQATISGSFADSGTLSFVLKDASNNVIAGTSYSTTVSGDNNYNTPGVSVSLGAGTYHWVVSLTADANNNAPADVTDESFSVGKATPSISTTVSSGSVTVGASIFDKATVTGGYSPTGTVTFQLYSDPTETNLVWTDPTAEPLNANGVATSASYTTAAAGDLYWVATYNGDANNKCVSSGASDEHVVVNKATPGITTTVSSSSVTVGDSISDKATLSGGYNPTGTVTFYLYSNPNETGLLKEFDNEPLSGGVANSGSYPTTSVGTVYWVATYNGDANNKSVSSGATDESVVVNKYTIPNTSMTTYIKNAAGGAVVTGPLALGAKVYDTVSPNPLSHPSSLPAPGGTLTYYFYNTPPTYGTTNPDGSDFNPTGSPVGCYTVTLSNGSVPDSMSTGGLGAGSYWFIAVYNGDGLYNSLVNAAEPLTISAATISGYKWDDANGNGKWDSGEVGLNGVTFQLYQETNKTTGLQTGTGGDTLVATTTTAANGSNNGYYSFSVSTVGTYYIKEVVPTGWVSTTANPVTVVMSGANVVGRYGYSPSSTDPTNFGDAHITTGTGNAGTIGFWTNTNGQTVLTGSKTGTTLVAPYSAIFTTAAGTAVTNGHGALGLANTTTIDKSTNKYDLTVLVDGNGNYLSQSYFSTYANVANYLKNASATNMAYMLGAQMLGTEFNIAAKYVNASQSVYIPNVGMSSADTNALQNPDQYAGTGKTNGLAPVTGNYVQISTAINDAITALLVAPNTSYKSPTTNQSQIRYYQEALQNIFVSINQNGNIFVS
jgi:hypothetical protein